MSDDPQAKNKSAAPGAPDSVQGRSIVLPETEGPLPELDRPPEKAPPAASPKKGAAFDPRVVIPLDMLDPAMPSTRELHERREAKRQARRKLVMRLGTEAAVGLGAAIIGIGIYQFVQRSHTRVAHFDEGVVIAVDSDPQGATIFVDGRKFDEVTPTRLTNWDFALPHHVRLELAGYYPDDHLVEPAPHPPDISAKLPHIAHLTVRSEPDGATVTFAGHAVAGPTPTTFDVPAGRDVAVEVTLEGHLPITRHLLLQPEENGLQEFKLSAMAILAVRTDPPGARCTVDDGTTVATPADFNLAAGVDHHVRLTAADLPAQEKTVKLKEGKRQELTVRFEASKDRHLRARIDALNREATADQRRLDQLDGKRTSNDMFATFGKLNREDKLSDAADQADAKSQELSDQLSQDQLELEDRLKAENLKDAIPAGTVFTQRPQDAEE